MADKMTGARQGRAKRQAGGVPCEAACRTGTEAVPAGRVRLAQRMRRVVGLAVLPALAVATATAGIVWLDDRKYYIVSLLLCVYALAAFFLRFERRRPQAREIVVIAVLVALAVAGRAAFFMLPQFKPVVAVVVVAGVSFGAESGFLVGALSGFLSNFFAGQGPWTPWQMLALGLIGLLAGLCATAGVLKPRRIPLAVFGALSAFVVYGGVVDLWTILGATGAPSWGAAASVYALALPFNAVHALASAAFLLLLGEPVADKLTRVKIKYGMLRPGEGGR